MELRPDERNPTRPPLLIDEVQADGTFPTEEVMALITVNSKILTADESAGLQAGLVTGVSPPPDFLSPLLPQAVSARAHNTKNTFFINSPIRF